MTENKLKPCPFCGGDLMFKMLCSGPDDVQVDIQCRKCGLRVNGTASAVKYMLSRADERWISVNDALPKTRHKKTIDDYVYYDSDPVAVVTVDDIGDRAIGTGTYYIGIEDGKPISGWDGVTVEDVGLYNCTVTHWMPLPKMPEVEE